MDCLEHIQLSLACKKMSVTEKHLGVGQTLASNDTKVVDVTENGFQFDGKSYRSLSAVARQITGAQWSGPRFFGL